MYPISSLGQTVTLLLLFRDATLYTNGIHRRTPDWTVTCCLGIVVGLDTNATKPAT